MADLSIRSNYDVQRIYNWQFIITSPLSITLDTFLIESVSCPFTGTEAEPFHVGGGSLFLPSFFSTPSLTLEMVETNKGEVLRFLESWKELVVSKKGVFGYPSDFKVQASLLLLDLNKDEHTTIKLEGLWPANTPPIRFTYQESDKVTITQDFSVDRVWIDGIETLNRDVYLDQVISDTFGPLLR